MHKRRRQEQEKMEWRGGLAVLLFHALLMLAGSSAHAAAAQKLQRYNADPFDVAVVGVSAGGAMAIQLHVAFSRTISGAGVIAGPPYWCAMNNVVLATTSCMSVPDLIDLNLLWAGTTYAYGVGSIDNPSHLASARVWLYSGGKDSVVSTGVVKKARMFYEYYVKDDDGVKIVTNISSEHAWITDKCDYLGEPFINNCGYDASGAMLRHIYPQAQLKPRAAAVTSSNILSFSQGLYTVSPSSISMGDTGYVYVPASCQRDCKLVVALHGCEMDIASIKNAFYAHSGLNEWAETNNLIVLYPQVKASPLLPYNPKACWDWWGYSSTAYASQLGPQMAAIKRMIDAITGQ